MINALEHVPSAALKAERKVIAREEMASATAAGGVNGALEHSKMDKGMSELQRTGEEADADNNAATSEDENDDEEDEEEEEDDDEDTDVPDDLLISSDEEAELEKQRISFQELINNTLLQADGRRSSSSSSSGVSTVPTLDESMTASVDKRSATATALAPTAVAQHTQEIASTLEATATAAAKCAPLEVASALADAMKRRCQQRANSSGSGSGGSSLVIPPSRTEACGSVFVFQEQQKLIFHCRFCSLRYGDIQVYTKHLQDAHRLFHEEALQANGVTPQRKSARNQAKAAVAAQAQAVEVKTEQLDESSLPATLQTCGSLSVLNRKKLFFNCSHCECKYALVDLFYKHLRQQHDTFAPPPALETPATPNTVATVTNADDTSSLEPKREVKSEANNRGTVRKEAAALEEAPIPAADKRNDGVVVAFCLTPTPPPAPPPLPPAQGVTLPNGKVVVALAEGLLLQRETVRSALTAQTPETPPPEEEEEPEPEKLRDESPSKHPGQLQAQEEPQVVAPAQPLNKEGKKRSRPKKSTQRKEARTVADAAEQQIVVVDLVTPTKKPRRIRTTATKRRHDVVQDAVPLAEQSIPSRRASATQKSSKDFLDQQPPSSPESANSTKATLPPARSRLTTSTSTASTVAALSDDVDSEDSVAAMVLAVVKSPDPCTTGDNTTPTAVNVEAPNANNIPSTTTIETHPRFSCEHCNKAFNKASRLSEHRRIHTGEKPFRCDECGKQFRIKMRLTEHQMRHRKDKAFKCDQCGLAMATKQDLALHNRHHSGDRRFRCTECPKAFVRSSDLKIHLRVHTGEKPYVCEHCQKSFSANQNLIVHRRSHSGEKNYPCEFCEKRFMRNIDRKVHYRTHTGEKPFKCDICGRGYSSRVHVRTHVERDHGVKQRQRPGPKPKQQRVEPTIHSILFEDLQSECFEQIEMEDAQEQRAGAMVPQKKAKKERKDIDAKMQDECVLVVKEQQNTSAIPNEDDVPVILEVVKQVDNQLVKFVVIDAEKEVHENNTSAQSNLQQQHLSAVNTAGVQQVSVTVSMQVENVGEVIEPTPLTNTPTANVGSVGASVGGKLNATATKAASKAKARSRKTTTAAPNKKIKLKENITNTLAATGLKNQSEMNSFLRIVGQKAEI